MVYLDLGTETDINKPRLIISFPRQYVELIW